MQQNGYKRLEVQLKRGRGDREKYRNKVRDGEVVQVVPSDEGRKWCVCERLLYDTHMKEEWFKKKTRPGFKGSTEVREAALKIREKECKST